VSGSYIRSPEGLLDPFPFFFHLFETIDLSSETIDFSVQIDDPILNDSFNFGRTRKVRVSLARVNSPFSWNFPGVCHNGLTEN
jgi:hypothetical protein